MDRGVTPRSGRIERGKLRPGDHIYVWRLVEIIGAKVRVYSHHGIYESDEKVIELTSSTGAGCPRCLEAKRGGGVVVVCLDCFLDGGELCLFAYGVPKWFYDESYRLFRQPTCSMEAEDPPKMVLDRANFLLDPSKTKKNELLIHGRNFTIDSRIVYNPVHNNCFHFAFYCKTGLVYVGPVQLAVEISKELVDTWPVYRRTLRKNGSSSGDGPDGSPEAGRVVVHPPAPTRTRPRSPEPARDEQEWRRWLPEPGRVEFGLGRTNLLDLPSLLDRPVFFDRRPPPARQQTIFGSSVVGSAVVGSTLGALFRMAPFFV